MPEHCPICGSIDIIAGRCQHCGSEAVPDDLLQFPPGSVVSIKYSGGSLLMDAKQFHKIRDSKFKKLIGGTPNEKRNNVRQG